MSRTTSKVWYGIAGGLVLTGIVVAIVGFTRMSAAVEGMHRVVMPGKAEVVLPAGRTTLYGESASIVDGKVYRTQGLSFMCHMLDASGAAVPLAPASPRVSYAIGGYAGNSDIDFDVPAAGTYVLECEGQGPFAVALGQGVGTWIVVAVAGVVPAGLGVLTFLIVLIKRRRQRRRAAAGVTAPGGPPAKS